MNAAKGSDKAVRVAHGYGFVANRSKVTRAETEQNREDFIWVRGLRVVHYRRIGFGVNIGVQYGFRQEVALRIQVEASKQD
jgi:hypothetical protein